MGNLLFWLGIGAAQKGAGSKPIERRHWVVSLVVGILVALLIAVGMFFLSVSQQEAGLMEPNHEGVDTCHRLQRDC
jgi:ATP/ADP translocase